MARVAIDPASVGLDEPLDADEPKPEELDEALATLEAEEEERFRRFAMISAPGWAETSPKVWTKEGCRFSVRFSSHRKQWRPEAAPFVVRGEDGVALAGNNTLAGAQATALVFDDDRPFPWFPGAGKAAS